MTHYTIRRTLPPADRSEPLPDFIAPRHSSDKVRAQAAEDYYTKPRYVWCGTHNDEHVSVEDHIAALDAEHGHPHVAEVCDAQPEGAE